MAIVQSDIEIVNTGLVGGEQDAVQTVALASGGFITAWNTDQGIGTDIRFQRFDAAGKPVGDPVAVNITVAGNQTLRDIAVTDDGNVTLVWTTDKAVFMRTFDADTGVPVTNERSVTAAGPTATGAQIVAVSDTEYKVVLTSNSGGATVIEQVTLNTAGAIVVAKAQIPAILTAVASVVEVVEGNLPGSHFILLDNGTVVSSVNGSTKNGNGALDIVKLQNGTHVLAGEIEQNIELTGLFGDNNQLSSYDLGRGQPTGFDNPDAVNANVFDRALVNLGNNRILVVSVVDSGTTIASTITDGIYATVYNVDTGGYEEGLPVLISDFGKGGIAAASRLEAIDLEAVLLADGRVQLSWSEENGLSGTDVFSTILDSRDGPITVSGTAVNGQILGTDSEEDTVSYEASNRGVRVDLELSDMNTGDAADDILQSIEIVIGSDFNDKLRARDSLLDGHPKPIVGEDDTFFGGGGDDQLVGRSGSDTLNGGDGNDIASGGSGQDHLFGDDGDDVLYGNADSDHMLGGTGNDFLAGNAGEDVIDGGDGNDTINGGLDDDVLDGGAGNDIFQGGLGFNVIDGGSGIDTVSFADRQDAVFVDLSYSSDILGHIEGFEILDDDLIVNVENIAGSSNDDILSGNAGVNALRGNDGDDFLYGRGGADRLNGGKGVDTFFYNTANEGGDRIADFVIGTDKLQIVSDNFGGIDASNIKTAFQFSQSGLASGSGPKIVMDWDGADIGNLYYDADGGGAGSRVLIATISVSSGTDAGFTLFGATEFLFA